ncbi:Peroxidasin-like protein [Plecturocebus cupreus]
MAPTSSKISKGQINKLEARLRQAGCTDVNGVPRKAEERWMKEDCTHCVCEVLLCHPGWNAVQWCHHGSPQPPPPGLKQSSHLSPLSNWHYRCTPACPANFFGFTVFPKLISNFWPQAVLAAQPPKAMELQALSPRLECRGKSRLTATSTSQVQVIPLPQFLSSWAYRDGVSPCWHLGQADLELLTSSGLPALVSQSARITGKSHCPWILTLGTKIHMEFCSCFPAWSVVAQFWLTTISASWVQAIVLPQPPEYLGLQACITMPG